MPKTFTSLAEAALAFAIGEIGVAEVGRNSGPRVEEYLRSVGLEAGQPWCAAFMHWLFDRAARQLRLTNPVPKTGGVLRMWELADQGCRDSNPHALSANPKLGEIGRLMFACGLLAFLLLFAGDVVGFARHR